MLTFPYPFRQLAASWRGFHTRGQFCAASEEPRIGDTHQGYQGFYSSTRKYF